MIRMRILTPTLLLAAVVASVGCSTGPISATSAHLTRYQREGRERVGEQVLEVDLATGRTAMADASGNVYPSQLPPNQAEAWRDAIASRDWNVSSIKPESKATGVRYYQLTVFDGDARVGRVVTWAVPPAQPLPETLDLFTQTFDRFDRMANPVSGDVNLLE